MKHILSLGAGVQSSTTALMAAAGEITPMPDCAVFADTQAEPRAVYEWLDWLEKQLPFKVYRVTAGNLEADTLQSNERGRVATPPFYTGKLIEMGTRSARSFPLTAPFYTKLAGSAGKEGQLRRQCTRDYKIDPIRRFVRQEIMGLEKGERAPKGVHVTMWIGISTDESHRAKLSHEKWSINRHPLLELDVSRQQCLDWMKSKGYPMPAKSACYFCPYHDNAMWRDMKLNQPEEFARAVNFDEAIRFGTVRGVTAPVYLHRSCKPLAEVDFRSKEDAGQAALFGGDPTDEKGFAVECEGMCGM